MRDAHGKLAAMQLTDDRGCRHVADPQVVDTAVSLIDLFEQLTGKSATKASLKHFYAAAQRCIDEGRSPEDFVRQQVRGMQNAGTVWPTCINKEYATGDEAAAQLSLRHIRAYESMLQTLEDRCRLYGPREVLEDPTVQFSPLFRAVMANAHQLKDLADRYRADAINERLSRPEADQLFGDLLRFLDG